MESNNPDLWGEPFRNDEYNDLINEYSIEPKISLKNEPKNLYDVVKTIIGEAKTYSRICIVAKLRELSYTGEKITREIIINSITAEIKSISVSPNYFLSILSGQFIVLLLEVIIY